MDENILSIIIPIYNAEKTIERTINSLTYNSENIEIICINDGSTDNSESILNNMADFDKRITVINQNNQGASIARNAGIDYAHGEYIMFCDADDEYSIETIRCIKEDINQYEPDYIVFGRKTIYENGQTYNWIEPNHKVEIIDSDWKSYFNFEILKRNHSYVVYNKVYKSSIIKAYNIRFEPQLKLSEDLLFNIKYIKHSCVCLEDTRTEYIQHKTSGSLTASKRPTFFEDNTRIISFIKRDIPEYRDIRPFLDYFCIESGILGVERALKGRDASEYIERIRLAKKISHNPAFVDACSRGLSFDNSYLLNKAKMVYRGSIIMFLFRYVLMPSIHSKIKKIN